MCSDIAIEIEFIGRTKEVLLVDSFVKAREKAVLVVSGIGGIGKTTLLSVLSQKYSINENILIPHSIDFDDVRIRSLERIHENIARDLEKSMGGIFDSYFFSLNRLYETEQSGTVSDDRIDDQRQLTYAAFFKSYDQVINKYFVILCFDTCEKAFSDEKFRLSFIRYLANLKNTLIIIAGRNMEQACSELEQIQPVDKKNFLTNIDLSGFDWNDAQKYINRTAVGKTIPADIQKNISFLAKGRPIILDLAVDWWSKRIEIEELRQPLDNLNIHHLEIKFESALVKKLTTFQENIYWPILYMAIIDREGFTPELFYCLRPFGLEEDLKQLLDSLKDFSFIKRNPDGTIILHEEMRRLVKTYVWPLVDPQETIQTKLFQAVIDYYEKKLKTATTINNNTKLLEEDIVLDILYYRTLMDYENGLYYFRHLFEEKIDLGLVSFCESLIKEFKKVAGEKWLYDEQMIVEARIYKIKGLNIDARKLCEGALQNDGLSSILKIDALSVLATVVDFDEGIKYLNDAASSAKNDLKDNVIFANILSNIALLHQERGNWRNALSFYQNARKALLDTLEPNPTYLSTIENGIATIYNFRGDNALAKSWCLTALKKRKDIGNERLIAFSFNSLADIYISEGNGTQALESLYQSLQILEKKYRETKLTVYLSDLAITHVLIGKVYLYVLAGADKWQEGKANKEFEIAQNILDSIQSIDKRLLSNTLMLRGHSSFEHAQTLQGEQSIMLDDLHYNIAKQCYESTIIISSQYNIKDILCESLIGLANIEIEFGNYVNAKDLLERSMKIALAEEYYLILSKAEQSLARIDLRCGIFDEGFRHFGLAAKYLIRNTDFWFDKLIDVITISMQDLDIDTVIRTANLLRTFWIQENLEKFPKFINAMQAIIEVSSGTKSMN